MTMNVNSVAQGQGVTSLVWWRQFQFSIYSLRCLIGCFIDHRWSQWAKNYKHWNMSLKWCASSNSKAGLAVQCPVAINCKQQSIYSEPLEIPSRSKHWLEVGRHRSFSIIVGPWLRLIWWSWARRSFINNSNFVVTEMNPHLSWRTNKTQHHVLSEKVNNSEYNLTPSTLPLTKSVLGIQSGFNNHQLVNKSSLMFNMYDSHSLFTFIV